MKNIRIFYVAFILFLGSAFQANAEEVSNKLQAEIFEYQELKESIDEVKQYLHDYGFIAIRGVPGYLDAKAKYLELSQAFVLLDDEVKAKSTPSDAFARGWSYGIEVFNGKLDAYKGSYYALIAGKDEDMKGNIWPTEAWERADEFKEAYLGLAGVIFATGKELLPMLGLEFDYLSATGRMLYYGAINNMQDSNSYWCGVHRDHGLFTGLIPAMYKKDGVVVNKPEGTGLHIRGQEVVVPDDVMIFQVGETADLLTNQEIIATDHHVKKAYGGYERYTFALFFGIDDQIKIHADKIDPQYESRYKYGMTFKEWCEASLARYKK